MSYQALLFCPDEKTARVVTQVLSDLEFNVEPCAEPFSAVKKLMAQHYDALVVDCENEQNATLLFKSARNSESNQNSLAVAVVEGQAGVAKAFRIGANLVLTKPINVEQSKGTLRVARGLLRKADATKLGASAPAPAPAAEKPASAPLNRAPERTAVESKMSATTPAPWPKPDFTTPSPSIQTAIARGASSSSAFEVEADAAAKPEPSEAALLESLPELTDKRLGTSAPASKQYPWQPVSKLAEPMASSLRRAAEAAGKTQDKVPAASAAIPSSLRGAAAAPAPAKETSRPKGTPAKGNSSIPAEAPELENPQHVPVPEAVPTPKFESADKPALTLLESNSASGGGKKLLVVAVVVLAAAASGYVGWTRMHASPESATLQKPSSPLQGPSAVEVPAGVPASASAAGTESSAAVSPAAPQNLTDSSAAAPVASVLVKPSKTSGRVGESASSAQEEDGSVRSAPPASVASPISVANVPVRKALAVTKSQPADTPEAIQPPPPATIEVASGSADNSLAGIVAATSTRIPAASVPGTVKVSQGVVQGLLIKKVSPVYPQQAMLMRVQGSVQLQATISKEGNISNVKTLSGDPALARAAAEAVRQWKYKPYRLNGEAVGIQSEITVNFKLPNQ